LGEQRVRKKLFSDLTQTIFFSNFSNPAADFDKKTLPNPIYLFIIYLV
jgi:hypothetical protein